MEKREEETKGEMMEGKGREKKRWKGVYRGSIVVINGW